MTRPPPPDKGWLSTPPARRPRRLVPWPAATALATLCGVAVGIVVGVVVVDSGDPETQVPQACLDAIRTAEDGFGYTADALLATELAWAAAERGDPDAVRQATEDVQWANDQLDALYLPWLTARSDCRAAAE